MFLNIYKNDIYLNYKHPVMDLTDFNASYLNKLLENIFKEQKSIFLLGDFNVNFLNYSENNQTN